MALRNQQLGEPVGFLNRPVEAGRHPGLVLFSEIFQVMAPIRRTTAILAGHGFVVAVSEVYHELEPAGTVLPYDTVGTEQGNAHKVTKTFASYDTDTLAALNLLKAHPACMGELGTLMDARTNQPTTASASRGGFCVIRGHVLARKKPKQIQD